MDFVAEPIDLVKTTERFTERHGRRSLPWTPFAAPIVRLADATLGGYGASPAELPGIRKCLLYLTLRLSWYSRIWIIPLPFERRPFQPGPFGGFSESDRSTAQLLVDSLMLTVTKYREALRSYHTNLAYIIFADILVGFEILCDWAERGVPLTYSANDCLAPLDLAKARDALHV
jgi:hypothetical protein